MYPIKLSLSRCAEGITVTMVTVKSSIFMSTRFKVALSVYLFSLAAPAIGRWAVCCECVKPTLFVHRDYKSYNGTDNLFKNINTSEVSVLTAAHIDQVDI